MTGEMLRKLAFAVHYSEATIGQLQCECGPVDLKSLTCGDIVVYGGIRVFILLVLPIDYSYVQLLR